VVTRFQTGHCAIGGFKPDSGCYAVSNKPLAVRRF